MAGYLAGNVDEWIYIDIADQHEDSIRFIKDCEKAIGKEIFTVQGEYSANMIREAILGEKADVKAPARTGSKRE